ncbi:MAG: gliding motility-associated C-terminal domain-containing protein, partial [Bacteroidales bacterium]|nr:gliding motility-associated C-terminal domain-containing protein [Bacteroidales bacterium]
LGEGVIFNGHGQYTNNYGYGPSDISSMFEWNFGNGDDSSGINLKSVPARYRDLDCYDVTLRLTDIKGCNSTIMESVRVRISDNPIKTIFALNPICTTDSSIVNIGYGGDNATITMKYLEFQKAKSRAIDCRTFIPDGKNKHCLQADGQDCFSAPIRFDDFPAGRTVQSAEDICSICINYEHTFMGDYRLSIRCPTGETAVLKYADYGHESGLPPDIIDAHNNPNGPKGYLNGGVGGSGMNTGLPYGNSSSPPYDRGCSGGQGSGPEPNYCDSICNMWGIGLDYCFSRNGEYTLTSGKPANTTDFAQSDFIATQDWQVNYTDYQFPTVPAPYAQVGLTPNPMTIPTKQPSDHEGKTNYYLPVSDLSDLEGCPLNGDWSIIVCDWWGADNGWVFNWALDFCGISAGGGCEYQVGIDSVIWEPDSAYGDFDLGYWRGLNIDMTNPTRSVITAHDTAGYFPINVRIYDEFGCEWDTTTSIQSVWSPTPELGDNILICDVETVILDASDIHTDSNYTYAWEPFGQKTDTIETQGMMGSSTLYTVSATHQEHGITCETRDSVRVNINHQPLPNFDPGVYPLEGCEPYTIHFENTSQYGDTYFWDFGDGDTSSLMSPTHTYGTGQYNFRYIVKSEHGCSDSLVYERLVTVYSSPVAQFSWEPMNPTVMHPEVTFHNLTIPQSDDNRYYWEIQYDRDNHISYHTLTDVNPTFEWETDGTDISGNYVARLIAMTQNMGPSGNIVECRDTIENSILLVNDFLQFPTAVTPNGDGVNDKFIIRNLIEGLGFPNNSLAVYDRWGKRIFYKENISKEEDFWDPAATNTPTGTYFWRFTGKGYLGDIQRNGVVEVIK